MTEQTLPGLLTSALGLPTSCRVDQRVPKKMLIENGAPTSADKLLINDHIEEIQWLAALKPKTVGVAQYRDDEREYLEVAVLCITARHAPATEAAGASPKAANITRLAELVHRAVPYPVLLLITAPHGLFLSLAHKRWAHNEAGKVVLDGDPQMAQIPAEEANEISEALLQALALARQPQAHLQALYQGWMDCLTAWQAAQITGIFTTSRSPTDAAARRVAILRCSELDAQIASLQSTAKKERQMARQVDINLEIKTLQAERQQAASCL